MHSFFLQPRKIGLLEELLEAERSESCSHTTVLRKTNAQNDDDCHIQTNQPDRRAPAMHGVWPAISENVTKDRNGPSDQQREENESRDRFISASRSDQLHVTLLVREPL